MSRRRLTVTKGTLELGELFPDAPLLLIGRSPACDMVLRLSGIRSVHFLLEWAGAGEFNPDSGMWVLTEIKNTADVSENAIAQATAGTGTVLGDKPVQFGGLTWKWSEPKLSRAELPTGTLLNQIQASAKSVGRDLLGPTSLEVIMLSPDGQVVVAVEHLRRRDLSQSKIMAAEPKLRLKWKSKELSVTWGDLKAQSLNASGNEIPVQGKVLEASDLLFLRGPDRSFYLRLVPRLLIEESPSELLSDPFVRFAAGFAVVMILLLIGIARMESVPEEIVREEKPRMATVEIKEIAPPPEVVPPLAPKPPEPEPVPEPVKPPPRPPKPERIKPERTKPQAKLKKITDTPKAAPKKPTPTPTPKKAVQKPIAAPAPVVTNVQGVGLLGSLKKTNAVAVVSADTIVTENSAIDAATAGKEKIIVASAPHGIVDMQKTRQAPTSGTDALAEASDQVTLNDDVKIKAVSAASGRFSGTAFTIDAGDESGDAAPPSGFGESVTGGLSRETVGQVVLAQRQRIRACYNTALLASPKLNGRLLLKWKISPDGNVASIQVVKSDFKQSPFESCVITVLRSTTYPGKPSPTTVLYPFIFRKP